MDGDFSHARLVERYDAELAKDLGNLVSRVTSLAHRYLGGRTPKGRSCEEVLAADIAKASEGVEKAIEEVRPHEAISAIFGLVRAINRYLDERRPWTLATEGREEEVERILYTAMDAVRAVAVMLHPVMPIASREILSRLSCDAEEWALRWEGAKEPNLLPGGRPLPSPRPLYPRMGERGREIVSKAVEGRVKEEALITVEDLKRVELVTATIKSASPVPGTEKLLKLTLDVGPLGERTVVAGIAQQYKPEELVGKQVVLVANLKPARIKGVESRGMILAAGEDRPLALLTLDRPVPPGTRIR
ncbi:MAG TPA: methionine--tRNA ligase subunit beta, partial [Armatimonadetes bacterium]|nr:methionine--tRNA ligase subunit beta [Armatimonadota bacterium]